ncbi:hypothetical protein pb186bvf_014259 [Paramecium bursaria]
MTCIKYTQILGLMRSSKKQIEIDGSFNYQQIIRTSLSHFKFDSRLIISKSNLNNQNNLRKNKKKNQLQQGEKGIQQQNHRQIQNAKYMGNLTMVTLIRDRSKDNSKKLQFQVQSDPIIIYSRPYSKLIYLIWVIQN